MSDGLFPVHPRCEVGVKLQSAIANIQFVIDNLQEGRELFHPIGIPDEVKQAFADGQTLAELKMALSLLKDKVNND